MGLSLEQIRKILKEPVHRSQIQTAVAHEQRLRLHSQTTVDLWNHGAAVTEFLEWVKKLIPRDKYELFRLMFRFPVKTVACTEEIFSALERIFDGRNPVFKYEFNDENELEDWEEFREKLGKRIWQEKGFDAMKSMINSVIIVDLPKEQAEAKPDPYFYFLPIGKVIDFELDNKDLAWIIFQAGEKEVAVYDDESYRIFGHNGDYTNPEELLVENRHEIGYCPAKFFWTTPISYETPGIKKSPLTNQLSALDSLLFYAVSKEIVDLFGSYPIYWSFEQDCDYEQESGRDNSIYRCDGGFLRDENEIYLITREGTLHRCPKCSERRLTGAGSLVQVPVPSPENENANLRDPVGIISIDRDSLEYNVEEQQRREQKIYMRVVGYGSEPVNDQAVNEKQIAAMFESQTQKLRNLKKEFEQAQEWTERTLAKLRYQTFIDASISYGTEFYLFPADFILDLYTIAREKGLDDSILDMLLEQYFETKYRNNPDQLSRQKILKNLDPFRHLTKTQVQTMYASGQINYPEFMVKMNFSTYVARFERENTNLLQFGDALNFDAKIQAINQTLLQYAKENQPSEQPAGQPEGEPKGAPGGDS